MWHPTANSVSPEEVTCGSNRRIALICPKCGYGKNGEWRPSIAGACRTGGGCPVCSGKVLVEGVNDVATVHPEIAAQWHPTLNEFPPTRVTSGSARHVYLVCKDCGYGANGEWHPMIAFAKLFLGLLEGRKDEDTLAGKYIPDVPNAPETH